MVSIAEVHAELTAPGQPFEMDEVIIRGVPTRVWKHAPPTLRAVLELSRGHGGADFLVYEDVRWSYEQHFGAVTRLAAVLRDDLGVRKGDRIAIAMRNYPEWSVAFWAATTIGAIAVPLNAWWTGAELAYGLRDSGSTVLFCDDERLDRLAEELDAIDTLETVLVVHDERAEPPGGARHFDDVLAALPDEPELPEVGLVPEDDATIFYTSGTTGSPKGVLGTHRNICTNLMSLGFGAARAARRGVGSEHNGGETTTSSRNVHLLSVPFFHATGCHSVLVANLVAGNAIVLMHKWDAGRALELIEREGVTNFGGVPAMVWQVIEHPDFGSRDLSSLRGVGYGVRRRHPSSCARSRSCSRDATRPTATASPRRRR